MFADGQTNVHCCPGVNTFLSTSKRAKQWSGSNEAHYLVTLNRFFWQKRLLNVQQELSVAFTGTLIARWWRQMEVLYFWSKQATVACIQRRVHIDEKQSLVWNTVLRAMQTCKAAALWEGPDVIKWLVKNLMFTFLVINRFSCWPPTSTQTSQFSLCSWGFDQLQAVVSNAISISRFPCRLLFECIGWDPYLGKVRVIWTCLLLPKHQWSLCTQCNQGGSQKERRCFF